MSDARVKAAIQEMEAWLDDPAWVPDADALARWDEGFRAAAAQAERAEGWPELAERAHAAGRRLAHRSEALAAELVHLKAKSQIQDQGQRALRGYGASSR